MHVGLKAKNHDYTKEITRCVEFIVGQIIKGRTVKTAIHQAETTYGYSITLNAERAINRNI